MHINPDPIAEGEWIAENLDDPETIFIQVEAERQIYDVAHLPRAVFAEGYKDFTTEKNGVRALVPDLVDLEMTLSNFGIDNSKRVVFYSAEKSMWPCRAYWVLRYYGFPNVQIADRSLAGLIKTNLTNPQNIKDKTIVCVVTGSGLKEPELAEKQFNSKPINIKPELETVKEAIMNL